MDNSTLNNKKIFVFGAGYYGRNAISALIKLGVSVLGVLDNDGSKDGQVVDGVTVRWFDSWLKNNESYDYIVVGSIQYYEEIRKQLIDAGVNPKSILNYCEIRQVAAEKIANDYVSKISRSDACVTDGHINVLYDGQVFGEQRRGGISRYYYEVMKGALSNSGVSASLFAGISISELPLDDLASGMHEFNLWKTDELKDADPELRYLVERQLMSIYTNTRSFDVYHPAYYRNLEANNCQKLIVTVHDMIQELFSLDPQTVANKKAILEKADGIITVSENTKRDLLKLYPFLSEKKIKVIYEANSLKMDVSSEALYDVPYILYVGTRSLYKNFALLAKTFSRSEYRHSHKLICFGGGALTEEELKLIAELGLADSIIQLGGSDEVLANLYANAELFVYPSSYEGFGLPLLEAMHYGTPVLTANISSLPEVGGDAAEYFVPDSEDDLLNKLDELLSDETRRKELSALGKEREKLFSWEKCADETMAFYREVLG